MTLPRISGNIRRAEQTQIIAGTFLEALKSEKRYLEVQDQVRNLYYYRNRARLLLAKNNR